MKNNKDNKDNLPTLRINRDVILPDTAQWENRFPIHSETSNRKYIIAQNKVKRHWGCNCPTWRIHRKCKHLEKLNLPAFEKPYEVNIIKD